MSFGKIITSAAIVASLAVSAQAQTYSNGTSPSGLSAPSPLTVDGVTWIYAGCVADLSDNFPTFTELESSPLMTIEKCLADCDIFQYAGIFGPRCFCADSIGNTTTFKQPSSCNYACRGNPSEQCGGSSIGAPQPISKRQITAGVLLTLYETALGPIIPPAVYTTVVATEYVSVCPTGLTTIPYTTTQTLTHCGCTDITPTFTIPMATTLGSCGCGPGGAVQTYTVTVPSAVAACPTCPGVSTGASIVTVSACPTTVIGGQTVTLAPSGTACPTCPTTTTIVGGKTVTLAPSGSACPTCPTSTVGTLTVTLAPSGSTCPSCPTSIIGGKTLTYTLSGGSATATGAPITPGPPAFTGAASHNGVAAGVVGAMALAAAML
ncbi:MAG: hypothetical protein M1818_005748 [Claussenomyces sp. TS43310]|nr:MAG: hypothetical protein M1818_005748 [Claussenomyces sp. TS43310]